MANICINTILLPPLIQRVVGAEGKEAALGLVVSMVSLIHTVEQKTRATESLLVILCCQLLP